MEIFIPLIFVTALLLIQIKIFKNLCTYLSKKYPDEWKKIAENRLGGSAWSATSANFNESLKTGFFAKITDDKVEQFKKFKTFNMVLIALVGFAQLYLAFLR